VSRAQPDKITLAREARGLTQAQLATRVGITQGHVSKIEMGTLSVTEELLTKIAAALGYPVSLFYMIDPVIGGGPSDLYHHRKRQSASMRLMKKIYAAINLRRIQITRLLKAGNFGCNIPKYPIEEHPEGPIDIAQMVRAMWNLPAGPIPDLTDAIERAGGIVVPCDFDTLLVDGVSQWLPGQPPMFFINARLPRSRYRMTLAHELAHVVMHAVPNANMEDEAAKFAGEFLMPARDIRRDLRHLSGKSVTECMSKLGDLKAIWRVSMQAILVHASHANVISPATATSVWRRMSQLGYKRAEPLEQLIPMEHPRTLRDIVASHIKQLGYTIAQLADAVGLMVDEFRRIYMPAEAGHLRAV
jgi:Zn-dependent peptidase ImmA (M78 family)/DNA-binding XRE family transcriptional regulator